MMFWEILSFTGWIISGLLILWLVVEVIKVAMQRNEELLNETIEADENEQIGEKKPH